MNGKRPILGPAMRRFFIVEGLTGLALALLFTLGHFTATARIAALLILVSGFGLGVFMGGTANRVVDRWARGRDHSVAMRRHHREHPDCPTAPRPAGSEVTELRRGAA